MKKILLAMALMLLVSIIPAAAEPSDFSNSPQAVYMQSINQGVSSEVRATGNLVERASKYLGRSARELGLPRSLWCADFMNMLVGGKDRRAISYATRGTPAKYGCVGCVVVTGRKHGQHVGIVQGYDASGNLIVISGNHGNRVAIGTYSRGRVIAYRYV